MVTKKREDANLKSVRNVEARKHLKRKNNERVTLGGTKLCSKEASKVPELKYNFFGFLREREETNE